MVGFKNTEWTDSWDTIRPYVLYLFILPILVALTMMKGALTSGLITPYSRRKKGAELPPSISKVAAPTVKLTIPDKNIDEYMYTLVVEILSSSFNSRSDI
jgi:hypothetical protein